VGFSSESNQEQHPSNRPDSHAMQALPAVNSRVVKGVLVLIVPRSAEKILIFSYVSSA